MNGMIVVGVSPFQEWRLTAHPTIQLLMFRMAAKGIELTEQEAWEYYAWCQESLVDAIKQVSGNGAEVINTLRTQLATTCARQFREMRTGKWEPPTGPRFETPDGLHQMLFGNGNTQQEANQATNHHGYL